jgi:hypothetical protein
MNKTEIANLFIKAAFIDSRLPITARPARLKGQSIGFFHSEQDIKDRRATGIRRGKEREFLLAGDDPLNEWRVEFWASLEDRISRNDVRLWELANELVTLVADEDNRRALWAWAASKVGALEADQYKTRQTKKFGVLSIHRRTGKDVSFKAWCRAEGIHEMTGSRRKDRAIDIIEQYLVRGGSQNAQSGNFGVLPVGPVLEHISDNVAANAPEHIGPTFERDRETVFAKEDAIFDWRSYRNERRRRLREARKAVAA